MKTFKRLSILTSHDLAALKDEMQVPKLSKYQDYLDQGHTGLDYGQLSAEEQKQVRRAVDNPADILAGPELLMWNNMQRQRRILFRF